ncbi:hypothetical protein [Metabacillus lacus]|uniref:hypothetical protein n=1 Tax=Metabacillus lacus TaxID=1983721 RepID=UPI001BA7475B
MYEPKTKENDHSVVELIEMAENTKKRDDAYKLLEIFQETSGYEPKICLFDHSINELAFILSPL